MKTAIKNRGVEEVVPLKGKIGDFSQLEVSVSFTSGGMNYFSGESHLRGFRLHCIPVSVGNGFRSSVLLSGKRDSGLAYRLSEESRYNAKKLTALAEQMDAQKVADLYEQEKDQEIISYINTLKV